jgi:ADP-ribose pyrophosphatase
VECGDCGFRHFLTPIPAACALVLDSARRLLITRRAHEPGLGRWGIPGGVIEPGERAETAAARELLEETGIEVAPEAFEYLGSQTNQYPFQGFIWPTLDLCFVARIDAQGLMANPDPAEVSEWMWCALRDVPLDEFAFDSNAEAVRQLQAMEFSA